MPWTQGEFNVPNNFVAQYNAGQKKIRADLMDENFNDVAGAVNKVVTDYKNADTAMKQEIKNEITVPAAATATPKAPGTAAVGTSSKYAREDHVHAVPASVAKLTTARKINGVSFDGSADITITATPTYCTTKATTTSTASASKPCVVVQNYKSGQNWYRVWSDGWIEQGGYQTGNSTQSVTLHKQFTDTNYTLTVTPCTNATRSGDIVAWVKITKTVSSFSADNWGINSGGDGFGVYWTACGY